VVFAEQRAKEFDVWREQFHTLRIPKVFHLRRDPFERADEHSNTYNDWWVRTALPRLTMARSNCKAFWRRSRCIRRGNARRPSPLIS
jgi:hypothetical protein